LLSATGAAGRVARGDAANAPWRARLAWAWAAALFLAAAPAARAGDLDTFGFGPRAIALGSAYTALATDWTAPYYNPGGLSLSRTLSFGAGFSYAAYDLSYRSDQGGADVDRRAARVDPTSAFSLGFATTLGPPGTILNRFGAGAAVYAPTRHTLTVDWETAPAEPQFSGYGARQDRLSMMPGVSFRVPLGDLEETQRLSIGVSANVLVNLAGEQSFSLGSSSASAVTTHIAADYNVAPNVGLIYWPFEWLSFGVTYRGEMSVGSKINVVIDLTGNGQSAFPLDLESVSFFQPQQVQGGFAIDPIDSLTISFDLTWKNWGAFKDPFLTVGRVIGQVDPNYKDTVTPRLGLEWDVADAVALRAGYFYEPSPAPPQRGATNMVDLDRHCLSFGAGYTFRTTREGPRGPDGAAGPTEDYNPISIDMFLQWFHLAAQNVQKDDPTNSGGVGAFYRASGEIFNVGISLTVRM
jgi:long-chain fatty acid transport protein